MFSFGFSQLCLNFSNSCWAALSRGNHLPKSHARGDNVLAMAHGTLDDESVCWLTQKQMPRFVRQSVTQSLSHAVSQAVSSVCLSVCVQAFSHFFIQDSDEFALHSWTLRLSYCVCVWVCLFASLLGPALCCRPLNTAIEIPFCGSNASAVSRLPTLKGALCVYAI